MGGTYEQSTAEAYEVRPYRPNDRDRFLSLYEAVWDRRKDVDWFEWRFEANPYREGVQMVVVEQDNELVAAEPLLPFRLRVGETSQDVYQPVDWIVHPDHRRQGLFTRMTEDALDRYLSEVPLVFNFPNELLLPGLTKFDWQTVGPVVCRYRVQNSRVFVDRDKSKQLPATASMVARRGTPFIRAGLGILDRLTTTPDDITVTRSEDVPVDTVYELYQSGRPDCVHILRDRPFLQWRFANPNWETTSYVATRKGEPVASIIAGTETMEHCRLTYLLDIQPMAPQTARPATVEALLAAVVDDASESDLIRAPSGYHPAVFRRYGFYRDDTFPLSLVSTRTTHAIRIGASATGEIQATLTDPEAWQLTIADLDIE